MTSLVFRMDLPSSPISSLVPGKLLVFNDEGSLIDTYNATSGCIGCQHKNAQRLTGRGPLPECRKVGIARYTVPTTGGYRSKPGIKGNFYHITPDPVNIQGVNRGQFGIHKDANFRTSPGSAGCVVMSNKEFARFENLMRNIRDTKNLFRLPLVVEYNKLGRSTPPDTLDIKTIGKHFAVVQPKPQQILNINQPITFSGTAKPEVSTIIVLVGPGGPFKIADIKQVGDSWTFTQKFVTKGVNRPIRFRTFDAEGNHLEDIKFTFTLQ